MYWKSIIPALLLLLSTPFTQAQTQKEDFDVVAQHLDTGGDLYAFINIRGDISKFVVKGNQLIQAIRDISPEFGAKVPPLDYAQLERHFLFSSLSAMGISSIKVEGTDYYRTNAFLNLGGEPQGIWRMFPNKPEPVGILKLAPPDANEIIEMSVDFMPLKECIAGCMTDVMGDGGQAMVDGAAQTLIPQTELTVDELLHALSTRIGGFAVIEKGKGDSLEKPMVLNKFLVRMRGAGPTLAKLRPWVETALKATVTETASYLNMEIPTATQIGTNIVLQISKNDGDAYLSSSINLIEECRSLSTTITDTEEYKKYATGLPTDVVSFVYITQSYGDNLRSIMGDIFAQLADKASTEQEGKAIQLMANFYDGIMAHYMAPRIATAIYADGGLFSQSNCGVSVKDAVILVAGIVPVGLGAAMAIPAFQKVYQTYPQKTILNNLRQIASASMQYMLDNGVEEVSYSDIVGPGKMIEEPLKSVAGESYEDIVITTETTTISVVTDSGEEVSYNF